MTIVPGYQTCLVSVADANSDVIFVAYHFSICFSLKRIITIFGYLYKISELFLSQKYQTKDANAKISAYKTQKISSHEKRNSKFQHSAVKTAYNFIPLFINQQYTVDTPLEDYGYKKNLTKGSNITEEMDT